MRRADAGGGGGGVVLGYLVRWLGEGFVGDVRVVANGK